MQAAAQTEMRFTALTIKAHRLAPVLTPLNDVDL
jgi:hypothetical protein